MARKHLALSLWIAAAPHQRGASAHQRRAVEAASAEWKAVWFSGLGRGGGTGEGTTGAVTIGCVVGLTAEKRAWFFR